MTRWKLHSWLLALVAASMLPCLAVLGWTFAANTQRNKEEARRVARAMALLIAGRADQELGDARRLVKTIARSSKVRSLRRDLCEAAMPVFALPNYARIATVDATGATICSSLPIPIHHSDKDRGWFQEAMSGRVALTRPLLGEVSRRWVQPLAIAILDDSGKPAGVAMVALDLLGLGSVLEPRGENGIRATLLIDLNGTVLASSVDAETWVGRNVLGQASTKRAIEDPSSSVEPSHLSAPPRFYRPSPPPSGACP